EGNKHFASKEYDLAIEHYSKAISLHADCKYYSNRSACYAGKGDWSAAASDATECIRLDPKFIKGYYRLVNAQIKLEKYDDALATAKQGLQLDEGNAELTKQVRLVKSLAAASAERGRREKLGKPGRKGVDEKEVLELQDQINDTRREMSSVEQYINNSAREQKMSQLTKEQLEGMGADTKMYLGFGKAFLKTTKEEAVKKTDDKIAMFEKKEEDYTKKMDYLKKKANSQVVNFKELVQGAR
ncbi:hypothetical protein TrRE_jg4740, partial [Triparma retinervis]